MLSRPADLSDGELAAVLGESWGLAVASTDYRPVGFGSHHWDVADIGGTRWFVSVDELETKRHTAGEPLDVAFDRLRAPLAAVRALHDHGAEFAVAPVPARDGEPLVRAGRFAVAVYPFVHGRSFEWGEYPGAEHRLAVLDLVVALHTAPAEVCRHAMADDFAVPHRDELEAAIKSGPGVECGPYSARVARLLADNATAVRRLLDRYDGLVARAASDRAVLTHGEPHPGNTMLTADGWRLIDWDTALVAPPERDLWILAAGDDSVLGAYAAATGVRPQPAMLELYRIRWDVADLAVDVSRFRRPHAGTADDAESWRILSTLVGALVERLARPDRS